MSTDAHNIDAMIAKVQKDIAFPDRSNRSDAKGDCFDARRSPEFDRRPAPIEKFRMGRSGE